jgi:hypothetical protein
MMRLLLAMVVATGCGFAPGNDAIDAAGGDGTPTFDAPNGGDGESIDAAFNDAPVDAAPCLVEVDDSSIVDRGRVGSNNGGTGQPVSCDAPGDVVVGIALQISDGLTLYNARSAQGIRLACAPLAIGPDGTPMVGNEYQRDRSGTGAEGWSPSAWTPLAHCSPGFAVSGFLAHLGSGANLFVDATIKCSRIGPGGVPDGEVEVLDVPESLTETATPEQVDCAASEILRRFETRTGSGLDAVNLLCAQTRCDN